MLSIEQSIQEVTELISLPEIYLKIRQLMDDPSSDIHDFAEVIRYDPNLSVTVLKVVNSAYYGFTGQIDSIARAVNMIGIGQLHDMVLGISAISSMDFPNDIVPLKTFWRSSLFSGVLSRLLAEQLKIRQSERLFVNGLLHEIGHLLLYAKFPEQARQTMQTAQENGQGIHEAEQQLLGCHYGQIGAMLMAQWNLSANFQTLTCHQPTPQAVNENRIETALLHLAHGYAHKQFTENEQTLDQLIDSAAWDITQLTPEQVEPTLETAQTTSADMEKVILG